MFKTVAKYTLVKTETVGCVVKVFPSEPPPPSILKSTFPWGLLETGIKGKVTKPLMNGQITRRIGGLTSIQ
jgi:hypothetical protein